MCSNHLKLLMLNKWVFFGKFLLLLREVVELAIMGLSVAMLGAEHVAAFACVLHCAHPLGAIPALVCISLNKVKVDIT